MAENRFYVHIVESPSPDDLLDGRTEGNTLCSFLKLAGIPCQYNLVVNRRLFEAALTARIEAGLKEFDLPPILHFSAHGNQNGLQLTHQRDAGEIMPWADLRALLLPLQQNLEGVGVCISSCGGLFGRQMAQVPKLQQVPMLWVVGSETALPYPDAALAFAAFYRRFWKGADENELLAAMRAASGVSDFKLEYGHFVQQDHAQRTARLQKLLAWMQRHHSGNLQIGPPAKVTLQPFELGFRFSAGCRESRG